MAEPLKNLREKHQEIKRLVGQGYANDRIAELMDMHPESVRQIRRSPLFQAQLSRHELQIDEAVAQATAERIVNDPVREALDRAKLPAVQKVISLMKGAQSEKLQSDNAWEILNRTGYKPKEEGTVAAQIVISGSQVLLLNEALSEAGCV